MLCREAALTHSKWWSALPREESQQSCVGACHKACCIEVHRAKHHNATYAAKPLLQTKWLQNSGPCSRRTDLSSSFIFQCIPTRHQLGTPLLHPNVLLYETVPASCRRSMSRQCISSRSAFPEQARALSVLLDAHLLCSLPAKCFTCILKSPVDLQHTSFDTCTLQSEPTSGKFDLKPINPCGSTIGN